MKTRQEELDGRNKAEGMWLHISIVFNSVMLGVFIGVMGCVYFNHSDGKDIPKRIDQAVYTKPKNFLGPR
jgi:hypothetical protein